MLTDSKIKRLRPIEKQYKISDINGLYIAVLPSGVKSFRFDYRFRGKRKTLTFGKYGNDGISLADARDMLVEARKLLAQGICPASYKTEQKYTSDVPTFEQLFFSRMDVYRLAPTSVKGFSSIYNNHIKKFIGDKRANEITVVDVRVVLNNAESQAKSIYSSTYSIMLSVFNFAVSRGYIDQSPMQSIKKLPDRASKPRDRFMTPYEIKTYFDYINSGDVSYIVGVLLKLLIYTMVRKMELCTAKWEHVDLVNGVWTIPADNMKKGREHVVYLSRQATELFKELREKSFTLVYVAESWRSKHGHISNGTLNAALDKMVSKTGIPHITVHDSRRTASTHLNELGYNADWIEKSLAHDKQNVRGVYNRAKYAKHRRRMLQEWADMVDKWVSGDFSDVEGIY
ncbi:tyrosine-type recombinase/integrase [Bisgaard Taxon 45]